MNAKHNLHVARNLLAHGWTQGEEARDSDGDSVEPFHPNATTYAPVGAIEAAIGRQLFPLVYPEAYDSFDKALAARARANIRRIGSAVKYYKELQTEAVRIIADFVRDDLVANGKDYSEDKRDMINAWNDDPKRTKDHVLKIFDRAISVTGDPNENYPTEDLRSTADR